MDLSGSSRKTVDINKGQPNENKHGLFRTYYNKGVSHHHNCLAETQRQEESGNFYNADKESSKCALIESLLTWEARGMVLKVVSSGTTCSSVFSTIYP